MLLNNIFNEYYSKTEYVYICNTFERKANPNFFNKNNGCALVTKVKTNTTYASSSKSNSMTPN
ncbi:hypothetical protein [Flavobacterium sp.]|uniref:hypothetical protein n=1 Tax=Flavobacterium sp. TaxID=239 RepID=UPI0025E2C0F3|nr:hypothetical protein [Flavobacterium sp.]